MRIILILLALALSSCGMKEEVTDLTTSIEFNAVDMDSGEETILNCSEDEDAKLTCRRG